MSTVIPFKQLMTYRFSYTLNGTPYRCTTTAYSKAHALRKLRKWFKTEPENLAWVMRQPAQRYK